MTLSVSRPSRSAFARYITQTVAVADRFVPPSLRSQGPDAERRGRLVVLFSWALVIWGPPNITLFWLLDAPRSALAVALPTVCMGAVPWILRSTGSPRIALTVKLGSLLVCLFVVSLYGAGLSSAAGPWHIAVPVFAMLMSGVPSALFWGALSIGQLWLIYNVCGPLNLAPPPEVSIEHQEVILATHFSMVLLLMTAIAGIFDAVRAQAVHALEGARRHVHEAHRQARLVLDNIQEGLVLVDMFGCIIGEHSAAVERWFGQPQPGDMLWDVISPKDPDGATYLRLGFDEVAADVLPLELCIDQLPQSLQSDSRQLSVKYWPVTSTRDGDATPDRLLVVMSDITARLDAEQARKRQEDTVALTSMYLKDQRGLLQFLDETTQLLTSLRTQHDTQFRALHTIKGNSAVCGLHYLAQVCHRIEDQLQLNPDAGLNETQIAEVEAAFNEAAAEFMQLAAEEDPNSVWVSAERYTWLLQELERGAPSSQLETAVRSWRSTPLRPQLERLGAQAERLAQALHGSELHVTISDQDIVVPPEFGRGVWTALVHLIRNAIDHGIEPPSERLERGKPAAGHLRLEAHQEAEHIVLMIRDDGRGIDWRRLQERAEQQGLTVSHATRNELLFLDGLSTRTEVSDVSGRGVGMAAVRAAVQNAGGQIQVESVLEQGTCFLCRLPLPGACAAVEIQASA